MAIKTIPEDKLEGQIEKLRQERDILREALWHCHGKTVAEHSFAEQVLSKLTPGQRAACGWEKDGVSASDSADIVRPPGHPLGKRRTAWVVFNDTGTPVIAGPSRVNVLQRFQESGGDDDIVHMVELRESELLFPEPEDQ